MLAALATPEIVPRPAASGARRVASWLRCPAWRRRWQPRMDRRSAVQRIALARRRLVHRLDGRLHRADLCDLRPHGVDHVGLRRGLRHARRARHADAARRRIGDRFDRRRVMIVSDLSRPPLFVAVAFADQPALLSRSPSWPRWRRSRSCPPPARRSRTSRRPEDLAWANGRIASAFAIGITIGPAVAGGLIAVVGPEPRVRAQRAVVRGLGGDRLHRPRPVRRRAREPARARPARLRAGLDSCATPPPCAHRARGVRRLHRRRASIIVSDAPLATHFDVGSVGYGLLVAVWGLGMIGGAWWAGPARRSVSEPRLLLAGVARDRGRPRRSARCCRGSG